MCVCHSLGHNGWRVPFRRWLSVLANYYVRVKNWLSLDVRGAYMYAVPNGAVCVAKTPDTCQTRVHVQNTLCQRACKQPWLHNGGTVPRPSLRMSGHHGRY